MVGRWTCMPADRGSDVHYISWGDSAFSFIQTIDLAALHWLLRTSAQNWITLPPSYQFHNLDGKVPQCARGGTLSSAACALGFGGPRVAHHGQDPCREEMVGSRRGKSLRIIYAVYPCTLFTVESGCIDVVSWVIPAEQRGSVYDIIDSSVPRLSWSFIHLCSWVSLDACFSSGKWWCCKLTEIRKHEGLWAWWI